MANGSSFNTYEEEVLGKAYDSRLMKRLIKYIKPYKKIVFFAVISSLLVSLFSIEIPYLIKISIDKYISKQNFQGLRFLSVIILVFFIFRFLLDLINSILVQNLGFKTTFDIRMQIFQHLQQLSVSFYDKNPIGRLLTRVTSDVEAIAELFSSGIVAIFVDTFLLIGIITAMLYVNWRLALFTFTVLPLIIITSFIFRLSVREFYRMSRTRLAKLNAYLQENISGMRIVQLFNREKKNEDEFKKLNWNYNEAMIKSVLAHSIFFPATELIASLALAIIIWFGGKGVIAYTTNQNIIGQPMTIGLLFLFIQYTQQFFRPINDLTEKYNIMQSAMASSERIFKLLDRKPLISNVENPVYVKELKDTIEFRNVSFAYNDEDWVLKDVSFEVEKGARIAIVGATGAGKTSIINLLCRFYDIQKGDILIDGVNIKQIDVKRLRSLIGLVLQDVFIFSGTIKDNIRLGDKSITDDEIIKVARYVNADTFIEKLPKKYEAKVEERGATLSVGQKQLLSFARALAFNPQILILDEATSNIDTETELLIQDALEKLMKDRTSIVIAHRLSTIQHSDKIIVIHKGTIREIGTHQELLKLNGIYKKLFDLQYKNQFLHPTATLD